jgi:hypothetical protein
VVGSRVELAQRTPVRGQAEHQEAVAQRQCQPGRQQALHGEHDAAGRDQQRTEAPAEGGGSQ